MGGQEEFEFNHEDEFVFGAMLDHNNNFEDTALDTMKRKRDLEDEGQEDDLDGLLHDEPDFDSHPTFSGKRTKK